MMAGQGHTKEESWIPPIKAAEILGVHPKTVSRYHKNGRIPNDVVMMTDGGQRRFKEWYIRAMAAKQAVVA